MATAIGRFHAGTTKQFTVTYSGQPGTTPILTVYAGSGTGTLITSVAGTASSTIAYYAHVTMPGSAQLCAYTWTCSFVAGPVLNRGRFQVIVTDPG